LELIKVFFFDRVAYFQENTVIEFLAEFFHRLPELMIHSKIVSKLSKRRIDASTSRLFTSLSYRTPFAISVRSGLAGNQPTPLASTDQVNFVSLSYNFRNQNDTFMLRGHSF
jgi:hypothetical protein